MLSLALSPVVLGSAGDREDHDVLLMNLATFRIALPLYVKGPHFYFHYLL